MASFVLGTIGTMIGGPIGGYIGSTIGSYIDNNYLFPIRSEGPRLTDLAVTASSYGRPIGIFYGEENRAAGNIIASSGLIETKTKRKVSGKGGPAQKITEYNYSATFAVLIGEGEIQGIKKIWANNKVIFDVDDPLLGMNSKPLVGHFTDFFTPGGSGVMWRSMTVYPGDFEQLPDPVLQTITGPDTPAYRGSAYVVFERLQLADFGNRIPNIEFLVSGTKEATTGKIVTDLIRRCGLDPNVASTVALDHPVRGYAVGRETTATAVIRPLGLAFNFDIAEAGGALRAQSKTASIAGAIPSGDLGAVDGNTSADYPWEWSRDAVTKLPKEAAITYPDPERDFQPNTQTDRRTTGTEDSNLSAEMPIVMDVEHAQQVASRMLWEAHIATQGFTSSLSDRWRYLEVGRSYLVETPAGFEPLRLRSATRGANGVIEIEMQRDSAEVYSTPLSGSQAGTPPNRLKLPGASELVLLDLPLLVEADKNKESGFYVGVMAATEGWRGAQVLRASEAAGSYEPIADVAYDLVAGEISQALPPPPAGFNSATDFDDDTVIRVALNRSDMMLASVTDADLVAGANAIYVGPRAGSGGEIIQFGEAEMVSPGVYDLTHLKRGQRGTEGMWSQPVGSFFVLLETAALTRVDFGYSDVGVTSWYKAVSILLDEDAADPVAWTNGGAGLRPYAPVDLDLEGVTGGDLDLSWVRRSRIGWGISPPPLAEEYEAYVVQIRNAAGTSTVREINVSEPFATYTAAQQTVDFGAPVSSLRWRVAQISASYGPGAFASAYSDV